MQAVTRLVLSFPYVYNLYKSNSGGHQKWNLSHGTLTGCAPVYKKDFSIIFMPQMPIFLHPGIQAAGRTDRTWSAGLPPVLELRREKRLLRHGNLCKTRTSSGHTRHRHRNLRYRRSSDHPRIWQLLPCHLLHSKLPERTGAASLPHGMGRCFPRLSSSARQQKAGHSLRRFKCCTHGDRSENPKTNRKNAGFPMKNEKKWPNF